MRQAVPNDDRSEVRSESCEKRNDRSSPRRFGPQFLLL